MKYPMSHNRFLFSRRVVLACIFSTLLFMLCIAQPVGAIVTADVTLSETSPLLEASGVWDIDWSYVYRYKNSTAVAISPYWLLTTSHVADDFPTWSMTLGGTTYSEVSAVFHKDTTSQDPNHTVGADLALVRLDNPLPGFYDIYPENPRYMDAILIGFGYKGTVSTSSYTWSGGAGIKRWGTNRIDSTSTVYTSFVTDVVRMNFNLDNTPYEAGVAVFDSGGGAFVKDPADNAWKLAGINAFVSGSGGSYYTMDAVRVQNYIAWINNILANPDYFYYPSIPGDANEDGAIDVIDLGIQATYYGKVGGAIWGEGDFNFDGNVDVVDLGILSTNYGSTSPGYLGTSTPEPTSISLLILGGITLLCKRHP